MSYFGLFLRIFSLLVICNSFVQRRPPASRFWVSAVAKHKVTIQYDGKEVTLNVPETCSILDAALDAGIELPHDCKLGVCLTCPSRLVKGVIDQSSGTLDDSVVEQGFALTCCSYPRSDVIIRTIDEDELVSAQFQRS